MNSLRLAKLFRVQCEQKTTQLAIVNHPLTRAQGQPLHPLVRAIVKIA